MRKTSVFNKFWVQTMVFFLALIVIFFFLGYDDVFFLGPHGIHFIRQTDSLSFASQYFNKSFNFFETRIFNLSSTDGKAACEFPLTYYITAMLYAVFGKNMLTLKLLNLVILSSGVYAVFRMSYLLLRDYFYAAAVSLFLLNSTVFNYYAFNYLPDSPALGFTFLGWYFFFKYQEEHKRNTLSLSFVFFLLGSLIKVTYLINPLSILALAFYRLVFNRADTEQRALIINILRLGIGLIVIVLSWNIFILYYNSLNGSNYFNTSVLPIWDLSINQINEVWDSMRNYWHTKYFAQSSFHLLFVIVFFQFVFVKKSNFTLSFLTLLLLLGSLSYFILFYSQFRDHDYYFLAFMPLVVMFLISGVNILRNITANKYVHIAAKTVFSIVIIAGINYSRMKLTDRNEIASDMFTKIGFLIQENEKGIEKLNLPLDAKFVVAPDLTPNGGLFFLNRMGWNIEKAEDITFAKIKSFKDLGADFLLIDDSSISHVADLEAFGKLIFKGKGIEIYSLN